MSQQFLPRPIYIILFSLLGLVYILGLFVPLMDNDSAHHANIALHMYFTGDYVNLIDYGKDYLDKPHFHFWLAAVSYKVFGVTGFAYKLPSFLFTICGTYSIYRLGKSLYTAETGRLSALIAASSFAYILANNDVRMDAILTSAAAFTTWQLVDLLQKKRLINTLGTALGLAIGFSTKGHIGILVPLIAILLYILYKKDWSLFINWKLWLVVPLFALFIAPVVYCYYLQYNLHPEKIVRGKDHINGVRFILFGQSVERFSGDSFGGDSKNDYFFFLHSFLWAFAPWSILAYIAVANRIKTFRSRKYEWITPAVFIFLLLVVSFSGFKLPHYLNIAFPTTAVLTAAFLLQLRESTWIRRIYSLQLIIAVLLLAGITFITFWAFPIHKVIVIVGVVVFLSVFFYLLKSTLLTQFQKAIALPVSAITLCFFLLNANFYPQLLKYQAGNELAFAIKGKLDPADVYFWNDHYSSSFNFYTSSLRKPFIDSLYQPGKSTWLLYDIRDEQTIRSAGFILGKQYSSPDYEITKIDIRFVNPLKRERQLTKMILAEITGRESLQHQ